jgi:hypothetical protein
MPIVLNFSRKPPLCGAGHFRLSGVLGLRRIADLGRNLGRESIGEKCQHRDHGGMKFYYLAHVRDGKLVRSYSNYADPLDSNANPLDIASSEDTSTQLERFLTAKIVRIAAPASEDAGKPMAGKVSPFQPVE